MRVEKFVPSQRELWDKFVYESFNGNFQQSRNFLEYHGDKFIDLSMVIYSDLNEIIGVLPAAISPSNSQEIISHPGAAFGGLILKDELGIEKTLKIFKEILNFCTNQKMSTIVYKVSPPFFSGSFWRGDVLSLIYLGAEISTLKVTHILKLEIFGSLRHHRTVHSDFNKADKLKPRIYKTSSEIDYKLFYDLLNKQLTKHKVKSTHTLSDIYELQKRFSNSISLWKVSLNDGSFAFAWVWEINKVVHLQYLTNQEKNNRPLALNYLIISLKNFYSDKDFTHLSFGNSYDSRHNHSVNLGLTSWKEKFGSIPSELLEIKIEIS
jgi:hypothetical protein